MANMEKMNRYRGKIIVLEVTAGLLLAVLSLPLSAQVPPATTEQQTPLNLDSGAVVKEMSKEQHFPDTKPDVLSTTQNVFEQSISNSENQHNVHGIVEAGAGVGDLSVPHGFNSPRVNCENLAAALSDQISSTTQVGVTAQVDSCRLK